MLLLAFIFSLIVISHGGQNQFGDDDQSPDFPDSGEDYSYQELGYSESDYLFRIKDAFVEKHLNFKNPTQKDRNYVALLLSIIGMGLAITDGYSFNEAYAQWPGMVVIGKEFPISAREIITTKIQASMCRTQPIRDLIKQVCGSEVSRACDCQIEDIIKDDPDLWARGEMLLQIGYLTREWYNRRYDWVQTAASNDVENYLDCHKDDLRFTLQQEQVVFTMERNISQN